MVLKSGREPISMYSGLHVPWLQTRTYRRTRRWPKLQSCRAAWCTSGACCLAQSYHVVHQFASCLLCSRGAEFLASCAAELDAVHSLITVPFRSSGLMKNTVQCPCKSSAPPVSAASHWHRTWPTTLYAVCSTGLCGVGQNREGRPPWYLYFDPTPNPQSYVCVHFRSVWIPVVLANAPPWSAGVHTICGTLLRAWETATQDDSVFFSKPVHQKSDHV